MQNLVGFIGISPHSREPFGNWIIRLCTERQAARLFNKWEYVITFRPDRNLIEALRLACAIAERRWRITLENCAGWENESTFTVGGCYLLHFEKKYHHAQNYLGVSENIARRLKQHKSTRSTLSSKLTKAVARKKIEVGIVSLWSGGYEAEKALKKAASSYRHCPHCRARALEQEREYRARRAAANLLTADGSGSVGTPR